MQRIYHTYMWGVILSLVALLPATAVFAQTVSFAPATDFVVGLDPFTVTVGDFNGDGNQDLVVANSGEAKVSVLLGDGTGGFPSVTDFSVGNGPRHVAIGDFNGDGNSDLAVANFDASFDGFIIPGVSILLGTGTGSFNAAPVVDTFTNPDFVAIGDLNGDAFQDLAVTGPGSGTLLSTNLGDGTGAFSSKEEIRLDPINNLLHCCPKWVALADLNGDTKLDMVTTLIADGEVAVLIGNGDGTFGAPTFISLGFPAGLFKADLQDFDADGNLDLAVPVAGRNSVSILLGDGTGSFGAGTDFTAGNVPLSVATGDFDGDGKLDLAVAIANPLGTGTVAVLLGDGSGGFGAATDFTVGNEPNFVATGDFNGDTKPDLAVANLASNTVSILLNAVVTVLAVDIDIKPGSFPNSINLGSGGTVPVAIFSTTTFDATTIDPSTVTLESAPVRLKGKGTPMASFQDKNGDGLTDLVVHVSTEALDLSETDTEAMLEGQTSGGQMIQGSDLVRIVP